MKKMKLAVVAFAALVGIATVAPAYTTLAAPADTIQQGVNRVGGAGEVRLETRIRTIVNILLFVAGTLAVIMIIVGGIRYVASAGDSSRVKAAKDTIMYSVVGLAIAIIAYAIVNFVITQF